MKNKSAQDLLNESKLVFTSKCSWKEAFPTIEHIKVITMNDKGIKNEYNENSLSHYINCYNELCSHGGFDISQKFMI